MEFNKIQRPLVIKGTPSLIYSLLGVGRSVELDGEDVYNINGNSFRLLEFHQTGDYFCQDASVTLAEVPYQSEEEITAQKAVKKAEDSLKAAKEVLNKIKGK